MPTDIYARMRELSASAAARPDEMRPILLRVTTDLFALHSVHTDEEIRLYEEMAERLVDASDDATLTLVAQKLARCADAPPALLARLRARGGEAARTILKTDRTLSWPELRGLAASGGCDEACAVAARADLDRELTKILAGRPEREVARALAANPLAPLAAEDLRLLAARGRDDGLLAAALLGRGEITLDLLPLFLAANPDQRAKLLQLTRQAHLSRIGQPDYAQPLPAAQCQRLEADALRQRRASFAVSLAELIGCDPMTARRIVEDENGEALTIAFAAIGLPSETAAHIFLVAFPKISLSQEIFSRNLKLLEKLPRRDAQRVIAAVAGLSTANSGAAARPAPLRRGPEAEAGRGAETRHPVADVG